MHRRNDQIEATPARKARPVKICNADVNNAINGTSNNGNAVATLDTPFANHPPTLADMATMRAKFNELALALRR